MKYIAAAVSDIGRRSGNQDSLCVKIGKMQGEHDVVMAIICDGMGGLEKGELASGSLIRLFVDWFDEELSFCQEPLVLENISFEWEKILKRHNLLLRGYGREHNLQLGTTFSGLFIYDQQYFVMQIGDSRIYEVAEEKTYCLTKDQTLAMSEYEKGNLTYNQALFDPRRSVLMQCIGVSANLVPVTEFGNLKKDSFFVLCSDGLYHSVEESHLKEWLTPSNLQTIDDLRLACEQLVETAKQKGEKDNISLAVIKKI